MDDSEEDICLGDLRARAVSMQPIHSVSASAVIVAPSAVKLGSVALIAAGNAALDDEEDEDQSIGQLRAARGLPNVAPTATPVPQIVHGYTIKGKYAFLPGGFKLPVKLFDALYGYQRDGIAWMWSLHPESPMVAGALGRGEDAAATAALAPTMAAAAAAAAAQGPKISGGILADDMGLGKTLQVLSFITGCLHGEVASTALVLLPVSLLDTWEKEFARFAPNVALHILHDKSSPNARAKIVRRVQRDGGVLLTTYGMVTFSPHLFGATVGVDGEDEEEAGQEKEDEAEAEDEENEEDNDVEAENEAKPRAPAAKSAKGKAKKAKAGTPPVPDCVWDVMVLDEGHKVKNPSTRVAKAVRAVPARMRLLLSGTPIQNNLEELWALFDFTACGRLLDTKRTFNNRIAGRILKAREKRASAKSRNDGAQATSELIAIIGPYLLRREKEKLMAVKPSQSTDAGGTGDASIDGLTGTLSNLRLSPPSSSTAMGVMGRKKEVVLWCPMSRNQTALYKAYLRSSTVKTAMQRKRSREQGRSMLQAVTTLRLITSHPLLLGKQRLQELQGGDKGSVQEEALGEGEEEADSAGGSHEGQGSSAEGEADDLREADEVAAAVETEAAWDATRLPDTATLVGGSGKLRLAVLLMRLFAREGAKVLIFSQSVRMLDVLQEAVRRLYRLPEVPGLDGPLDAPAPAFMKGRSSRRGDIVEEEEEAEGQAGNGSAPPRPVGLRFVRIDGGYGAADRAAAVTAFNTDPSIAVALISTGVGSLGLTLTAATRVLIFDPSWNPSVDAQAVDRAYRVGQKRDVVTYRLITAGTIEEKMYRQQVFKSGLNATVMAARTSTGSSMTPLRFLSADDLRDLFKLGPTAYSATARIVDNLATPPPLPSTEIAVHLSSIAVSPLADAVVGVSHHDHLFRLQPESMAALAAAAKVEAAEQRARDKNGDSAAAADVEIDDGGGRASNLEQLRGLLALARVAGTEEQGLELGYASLSAGSAAAASASVPDVMFVGQTGPLVHPSAMQVPLVAPLRTSTAKRSTDLTSPPPKDVRLQFEYAGSPTSGGDGLISALSPIPAMSDASVMLQEQEEVLQEHIEAETEEQDNVIADEEEVVEEEEEEDPVSLHPLSPERAEAALGSARPRPPRRSMGLVQLQADEEEENVLEAAQQAAGTPSRATAVTICDAHRTAAALSGIHGATRCECYALPYAAGMGAGSADAAPVPAASASTSEQLMDDRVAPETRLSAALCALEAADTDPHVHLAAMHAAVQLGLMTQPRKENTSILSSADNKAGRTGPWLSDEMEL